MKRKDKIAPRLFFILKLGIVIQFLLTISFTVIQLNDDISTQVYTCAEDSLEEAETIKSIIVEWKIKVHYTLFNSISSGKLIPIIKPILTIFSEDPKDLSGRCMLQSLDIPPPSFS